MNLTIPEEQATEMLRAESASFMQQHRTGKQRLLQTLASNLLQEKEYQDQYFAFLQLYMTRIVMHGEEANSVLERAFLGEIPYAKDALYEWLVYSMLHPTWEYPYEERMRNELSAFAMLKNANGFGGWNRFDHGKLFCFDLYTTTNAMIGLFSEDMKIPGTELSNILQDPESKVNRAIRDLTFHREMVQYQTLRSGDRDDDFELKHKIIYCAPAMELFDQANERAVKNGCKPEDIPDGDWTMPGIPRTFRSLRKFMGKKEAIKRIMIQEDPDEVIGLYRNEGSILWRDAEDQVWSNVIAEGALELDAETLKLLNQQAEEIVREQNGFLDMELDPADSFVVESCHDFAILSLIQALYIHQRDGTPKEEVLAQCMDRGHKHWVVINTQGIHRMKARSYENMPREQE